MHWLVLWSKIHIWTNVLVINTLWWPSLQKIKAKISETFDKNPSSVDLNLTPVFSRFRVALYFFYLWIALKVFFHFFADIRLFWSNISMNMFHSISHFNILIYKTCLQKKINIHSRKCQWNVYHNDKKGIPEQQH